MSPSDQFAAILRAPEPPLALAPMQDVTTLRFWELMARHGGADLYFTEYFRIHSASTLEKWIVRSIRENPTGKPVIAQMIGNDPAFMARSARWLQELPVAAIDLNLGCPAPVVYRKCAGGGLLRQLPLVDSILGALRDAVSVPFTVKTRIGFDEPVLDALLPLFRKHAVDLVTVHGRTVLEMYRGGIHEDCIARAAAELPCPVLANGNIACPEDAEGVLARTGVRGLMIGRGAIRNPWIFRQIRDHRAGRAPFLPTGRDVLAYIHDLWAVSGDEEQTDVQHVHRMKKYMNFLGAGVDAEGRFLHDMRRCATRADFFAVCSAFLDHGEPMALTPLVSPDHGRQSREARKLEEAHPAGRSPEEADATTII